MYYPSFYCVQTVTHFSNKTLIETRNLFISAVSFKSTDADVIIAGDSEGTIHFLK